MRTPKTIAAEVRADWRKISPYAEPYLAAMETLDSASAPFYMDSGVEIVQRFLVNASGWRGEKAREIKAELKAMVDSELKRCPFK